jgi:predicted nucleotidyltransferase
MMEDTVAESRLSLAPDVLRDICRRNHIRRLSLYGSVLRADFRPDSDVDVMVEFEPGQAPGLFALGGVLLDLQELMGRDVDLKMPGDFPAGVRENVLATAQTIYAAD